MIETVDISSVKECRLSPQLLDAILPNFNVGQAYMAKEFLASNSKAACTAFTNALGKVPLSFEPHEAKFKKRVPLAIGLIRTGDATPYGNIILVSA